MDAASEAFHLDSVPVDVVLFVGLSAAVPGVFGLLQPEMFLLLNVAPSVPVSSAHYPFRVAQASANELRMEPMGLQEAVSVQGC